MNPFIRMLCSSAGTFCIFSGLFLVPEEFSFASICLFVAGGLFMLMSLLPPKRSNPKIDTSRQSPNSDDSDQIEYIELDDNLLYQACGLFTPMFDFAQSEQYKNRLGSVRSDQKYMIKNKTAVTCQRNWTVDGNARKGQKMTNDSIKIVLRAFNAECDNAVEHVKYNNVDSMKKLIINSRLLLNKLNESTELTISKEYLHLKLDELQLAIEYQYKKQKEKEEVAQAKADARELARAQKELEEAQKNTRKDITHYQSALETLKKQITQTSDTSKLELLNQKKQQITNEIKDLEKKLKDIDYRQENQRAGYVYVISNIGSFGENVFKIGMTRRLDPYERVIELGDASVPFPFDTHAMIFSKDAPTLETALHRAFDSRKLNMINTRREFFRVTIDEIADVIKNEYDNTLDYIKIPPAEQYRQSEAARRKA